MNQTASNQIKHGPIPVRLFTGDALTRAADLAFIGSNPKLLARIESGAKRRFERLTYPDWLQDRSGGALDAIKRARVLQSPEFVWKSVVAVHSRPSTRTRKGFRDEILDAMFVSVRHRVRPRTVLFVPYHQHPEAQVVLHTLLLIYAMMRAPLERRSFFRPDEIEIADLDDASLFERVYESTLRSGALMAFFTQAQERYWFMPQASFDTDPPRFNFLTVAGELTSDLAGDR